MFVIKHILFYFLWDIMNLTIKHMNVIDNSCVFCAVVVTTSMLRPFDILIYKRIKKKGYVSQISLHFGSNHFCSCHQVY
jgi:hypothetical protein